MKNTLSRYRRNILTSLSWMSVIVAVPKKTATGERYWSIFFRYPNRHEGHTKRKRKVSNIDYFGDSVYIYSLKQGIEDGFLAPFKVINITTNIGDG